MIIKEKLEIKTLVLQETPIKKQRKREIATDQEKIFVNHVSKKGPCNSEMLLKLFQVKNNTTMGKRSEWLFHLNGYMNTI